MIISRKVEWSKSLPHSGRIDVKALIKDTSDRLHIIIENGVQSIACLDGSVLPRIFSLSLIVLKFRLQVLSGYARTCLLRTKLLFPLGIGLCR